MSLVRRNPVAVAAGATLGAQVAVTPILHPTAPYLIRVPGTGLILAPSPRLMIWTEAAANFLGFVPKTVALMLRLETAPLSRSRDEVE